MKQYVVTVNVAEAETPDPAGLSGDISTQITECLLSIDGITGVQVVGLA